MNIVHRVSRFTIIALSLVVGPLLCAQSGGVDTNYTSGTTGVRVWSEASYPDVLLQTGNATTSALKVFNGGSAELLRATSAGNDWINTTNAAARLQVNGQIFGRVFWTTYTADGVWGVDARPSKILTPSNQELRLGYADAGLGQYIPSIGFTARSLYFTDTLPILQTRVVFGTSESFNRFQIAFGGAVKWGPGTTALDTSLYRDAVSSLRTNASLTVDGSVGIGATPAGPYRLDVNGPARVSGDLVVNGNFSFPSSSSSFSVGGTAPTGYPFYAASTVASRSTAIQLRSNFNNYSTSFIANLGEYGTHITHNREPQQGGFVDTAAPPNEANAAHAIVGDTVRSRLFQVGNFLVSGTTQTEMPRLVVKYDGKVGIGTAAPVEMLDVVGNIHVSGNINAKFQDVAEWVPSNSDLQPGTVVVLDPAIGNGVKASSEAYDTAVAGVVSAQPGIILGEAGAEKEQIATTGRVRVRVDATSAPIRVGDLLVTSEKHGMAMRSEPMEMGGRKFHQPGTIIGKALEPLEKGEGEILVLLSLQ